MANSCVKIVGGCLVEINRLDACGLPLLGSGHPNNTIRTKGLIQVELTPDIDNGTEIVERTMCGDLCINEKDCPVIKGMTGKLRLCAIDPAILEMLIGVTPIVAGVGNDVIGGSLKGESRSQCNKFSMKIWGKPAQGCTPSEKPWVVFGLPLCENAVISSTLTFANKQAQLWEIDFYAREGNADFVDPGDVFTQAQMSNHLLSWIAVDSVPTETGCGEYVTLTA